MIRSVLFLTASTTVLFNTTKKVCQMHETFYLKSSRYVYWSSFFSSSHLMRLSRRPNCGMASIWALLDGVWLEERTSSSRSSRLDIPWLKRGREVVTVMWGGDWRETKIEAGSFSHASPIWEGTNDDFQLRFFANEVNSNSYLLTFRPNTLLFQNQEITFLNSES